MPKHFQLHDLSWDSSDDAESIVQDYLQNMSLHDLESTIAFAHPDQNFEYISPQDLEQPPHPQASIKGNQINMKQINRDIRAFVTDPTQPATYTFPPMEKAVRKRIHSLALLYNLDSKSKGKARQRYLFLTRTPHTKKATNFEAVDRLVGVPIHAGDKGPQPDKDHLPKEKHGKGQSAKPKAGSIVAHGAMPIDADNIGNKLLRKMGWLPGAGLGPSEKGVKEPLAVVYKPDKRGIGS